MSTPAVEPNGRRVWLIYGRKSKDGHAGDIPLPGQVTRCRTLGDTIHEPPLTDVDLPAHHRSRRYRGRPAYDRLTELLRDWPADGPRPGILAMHTDRLHRTVRELEDLIDLLDGRDVPVHTVQAGPLIHDGTHQIPSLGHVGG